MKRKTTALLLALAMCLSLLTACGSGGTAAGNKPSESKNTASSTEQPKESKKPEKSTSGNAASSTEQPKESEKPKESASEKTSSSTEQSKESEKPEKSTEPVQEEPKEENNAGTKLLALLQEEWKNGFVEGEGPNRTYFSKEQFAYLHDGVVYSMPNVFDRDADPRTYSAYDIASKKYSETVLPILSAWLDIWCFVDGNVYVRDASEFKGGYAEDCVLSAYDGNGTLRYSYSFPFPETCEFIPFEHGILYINRYNPNLPVLLSYDLQKIADIPNPQREVAHGLKEEVKLDGNFYVADSTIWTQYSNNWYRLNTDTYEWEDAGDQSHETYFRPFCGKYVVRDNNIIDWVTGEKVFNCREAGVYPPVSANEYRDNYLCYFGGNKYLGFDYSSKEYRWVNLKDLTMSDPLPFPKSVSNSSGDMVILNDTYCVYKDSYGCFLWNYNTGEEETIYMVEK